MFLYLRWKKDFGQGNGVSYFSEEISFGFIAMICIWVCKPSENGNYFLHKYKMLCDT